MCKGKMSAEWYRLLSHLSILFRKLSIGDTYHTLSWICLFIKQNTFALSFRNASAWIISRSIICFVWLNRFTANKKVTADSYSLLLTRSLYSFSFFNLNLWLSNICSLSKFTLNLLRQPPKAPLSFLCPQLDLGGYPTVFNLNLSTI